jgi:hypothetical protein
MKPLPLPVRVAAGLAATAVDRARHLPEKLAGLPVTMVSQALQLSMRMQQQVTELAIKGDDALATLRPVEESPEWATFDEDSTAGDYEVSSAAPAARSRFDNADDDSDGDPWADEQQAQLQELDNADDEPVEAPLVIVSAADDDDTGTTGNGGPDALPGYADLTLPQVRARMRRLDADELTQVVEYERSHADRPEFVGMLTRRIGTLRDQR